MVTCIRLAGAAAGAYLTFMTLAAITFRHEVNRLLEDKKGIESLAMKEITSLMEQRAALEREKKILSAENAQLKAQQRQCTADPAALSDKLKACSVVSEQLIKTAKEVMSLRDELNQTKGKLGQSSQQLEKCQASCPPDKQFTRDQPHDCHPSEGSCWCFYDYDSFVVVGINKIDPCLSGVTVHVPINQDVVA